MKFGRLREVGRQLRASENTIRKGWNYGKALKLSPDNSKVLDSLSDSYEGLGNLEKSANDYERARECYQKA